MRDLVWLHKGPSNHRVLDLPVRQQAKHLLRLAHTEGTGETLAVEAHRRRHDTLLRTFSIIDSHVLHLDAGTRRGHDLVREEYALVIGQSGIDHRRRSACLTVREQFKVLAHLPLGCACPVRDRQGDGSDNHEDDEGHNAHDDALDATAAFLRHRGERLARLGHDGRLCGGILRVGRGRRRSQVVRGVREWGHRSLIRVVLFLSRCSLLALVRTDGIPLRRSCSRRKPHQRR